MTKGPDRNSGLHLSKTCSNSLSRCDRPNFKFKLWNQIRIGTEEKYNLNENLPHQVKTKWGYETHCINFWQIPSTVPVQALFLALPFIFYYLCIIKAGVEDNRFSRILMKRENIDSWHWLSQHKNSRRNSWESQFFQWSEGDELWHRKVAKSNRYMILKAYQMHKHGTVEGCTALESYQGDNHFILYHKVELRSLLQVIWQHYAPAWPQASHAFDCPA